MSNPKFLGQDLSIPTFTWSAGVDTSFPVTNLQNGFPDIYSKSNALTLSQYITIDFGTAVAINMGIVDGNNFASIGADNGIKLQYNTNDDTNWADAVTVGTFTASNAAQLLSFASQTKRYWRILFDSTGALVTAPYISNLFLATSFDFEDPIDGPFTQGMPSSDSVVESAALDGRLRAAATSGSRLNWEMQFKLQSDTLITSWIQFLLTVQNNRSPFYYIDYNSSIYCVKFGNNYNPATKVRYNQNDIVKFPLKTVLANY